MKLAPAVTCLFLMALPALAAPAEKRIYKVDTVIASVKGGVLSVQARGAAPSGGWTVPRLKLERASQPHTFVLEFVAAPPPPGEAVIQALIPVSAHASLRARPGITSLEVQAEANAITTQVLH